MKNKLEDLKVLLVEDQTESRNMTRNMLHEFGVTQVFECPNGRDALSFVDTAMDFIDLIICDWNMPEMTGLDFLKQLRTTDTRIPFLMVTGRKDYESVVSAKASGVTGYITKPFSAAQLEAKLRIVMQRMVGTAA